MVIIVVLSKEEFKKLKNRDPEIFKRLYNEYKTYIYNYLNIKTGGNSHVAEEILSDVFHSALISVPKLKNAKSISGWLARIASNRFNDYLRKMYREKKYDDMARAEFVIFQKDDSPDENLIQKEQTLMLNMALDTLKPDYKKAIKLKYLEKKSIRELAGIFKKNENATLAFLHRAREALKREIERISGNFEELI